MATYLHDMTRLSDDRAPASTTALSPLISNRSHPARNRQWADWVQTNGIEVVRSEAILIVLLDQSGLRDEPNGLRVLVSGEAEPTWEDAAWQ
jgi:hypothetical protein